ncbi:hypothetical protein KDI_28520 [Dictyobacter arantiisoli]|uniref:Uncharacterized protein n=1 Tax=Dictyobacter arantiisoli TaxID=2014874 RepID=A0A5A5TDD6_9CHLR|nr:hypothetical protein KDI_28520 [Dictyobacter arantiisoli]
MQNARFKFIAYKKNIIIRKLDSNILLFAYKTSNRYSKYFAVSVFTNIIDYVSSLSLK